MQIVPLTGGLGAELRGIDLSQPIDAQRTGDLRAALMRHQVLFARDQDLTPEAQLALTAAFGPVSRVPYVAPLPDHPDIIAVLKEADERNIGTFGGTWHSDFSFLPQPPAGSVLYALDVPPQGGDTLWADMYRAYAVLSDGMRRLLAGRRALHSGHIYGAARPPDTEKNTKSIGVSRNNPEADIERPHPIVRRHPDSGRDALFVNSVYTTRFEDMSAEESKPLLDFLYAHATRPEFCCRFSWTAGAVAIWDNRCTLHYAANDYDGHRRLMHRTTFAGEVPVMAGGREIEMRAAAQG
jgi:taurine dioxygenase